MYSKKSILRQVKKNPIFLIHILKGTGDEEIQARWDVQKLFNSGVSNTAKCQQAQEKPWGGGLNRAYKTA